MYLKSLNITSRKNKADYYYGYKSIFYKVCPRYISDQLKKAWSNYSDRDFQNAEDLFQNILKVTNNYSAVIGYASCLNELDKTNEAINFLLKNLKQFEGSSSYYSIELRLGDLYSVQKNYTKADSIYQNLIIQNPTYAYLCVSKLRVDLIKDSLISQYLKGNDFDKYNILKEMNASQYDYNSIPVLIDLAGSFKEEYSIFVKLFNNKINVDKFSSSYAMFKLSNYMLNHLDFDNAEQTASLALKFYSDKNFETTLQNNYSKIIWFKENAEQVLKNTIIK